MVVAMNRRAKLLVVSSTVVLVIVGAVWIALHRINSYATQFLVGDTVCVIALHMRRCMAEGQRPGQKALEAELRSLQENSVVHCWFDERSNPVDPWGKPFVFEYGDGSVLCRSCGPDGIP